MTKDEVFLLRAALEFYKERSERAIKKSVHAELIAFYRKEIMRCEDLLTKLEIV